MAGVISKLSWVSCAALYIIILVVVVNVIGRYFFHKPILGTVEIVELVVVVFAFLAMPYTALKRGHVFVELITYRLSRRIQAILARIAFFLSAAGVAFMTYQGIIFAIEFSRDLRQATDLLHIPYAPFRAVMALGSLLLCLMLLVHIFQPLPPEEKQKEDSGK